MVRRFSYASSAVYAYSYNPFFTRSTALANVTAVARSIRHRSARLIAAL